MISSDMLLSIASICYVFCAVPQLVKNFRFKDTLTQSILTNIIVLVATLLSLVAYVDLELFTASIFLVLESCITGVLIVQIIIWKSPRNAKKITNLVEKSEG